VETKVPSIPENEYLEEWREPSILFLRSSCEGWEHG
jgi:hypothetical protein